jgi:hypothetical protein
VGWKECSDWIEYIRYDVWDKGREVDGIEWENTVELMEQLGWDGVGGIH